MTNYEQTKIYLIYHSSYSSVEVSSLPSEYLVVVCFFTCFLPFTILTFSFTDLLTTPSSNSFMLSNSLTISGKFANPNGLIRPGASNSNLPRSYMPLLNISSISLNLRSNPETAFSNAVSYKATYL